ncbi:MAG: hypothetical protein ABR507_07505 [Actinomycetota bacterium]|nr:hypothetical protein [Actinomycetota bacterium]
MGTQAMTLRIPEDEYNLLKMQAAATDTSINELVLTAVRKLLTDQSRSSEVEKYLEEARTKYRVALDKLADM